jgi:hypothetical protein
MCIRVKGKVQAKTCGYRKNEKERPMKEPVLDALVAKVKAISESPRRSCLSK